MDSFLDWSSSLHQQNLGDYFYSRNLYTRKIWSFSSLLHTWVIFFFFFMIATLLEHDPLKNNVGRTLQSWGFQLLEVPHNMGVLGATSVVAA
jgi:hypothetical protein